MSLPRDEGPPNTPLSKARAACTPPLYVEALGELKFLSRRSFQKIAEAGLPRSTAHLVVTQKSLPARRDQVVRFVLGCCESPDEAELWAVEWDRLATGAEETPVEPEPEAESERSGPAEPPEVVPEPERAVGRATPATSWIFIAAVVVQMALFLVAIYLVR